MKKLYLAGLFVVPIAVTACGGDTTATAGYDPNQPLIASVPVGVVQPAIQQQGPAASDGSVTLSIRVLANQVGVSAYQGAVTFTPGSFELVAADAPAASTNGEGHLVNAEGFAQGRVRFAAFTPTTFRESSVGDGVEALRLTVRPLRPIDDADLVAALDVVSGETGVSVQASRVVASSGVVSAGPGGR